MKTLKLALALAVVLALIGTAVAGTLEEKIEKEFDLGDGGTVRLRTNDGKVTITAWNKDKVQVKALKKVYASDRDLAKDLLEEIEIRMDMRGKVLTIRVIEPQRRTRSGIFNQRDRWESSVIFDIKVPKEVSLEIEADGSDVSISGTEGKIVIATDEGGHDIESVKSDEMRLSTDEGDIRLTDISILEKNGDLDVSITVDEGRVYVSDAIVTTLDIQTDEGDVKLEDVRLKELYIELDEGDVTANIVPAKDCRIRIETDEGDIRLRIPEDSSVSFDLFSDDGRIRTDFEHERRDRDSDRDRRYRDRHEDSTSRIRGKVGDGDGVIRIYTDEGSITLAASK